MPEKIVQRIVILGCAGSGKTTLARQLGGRTGAPVICLDDHWRADWSENEIREFRARMMQAHAGDRWVSDGNFAQTTFDIRLPRATLIIWMERSKRFCYWRAATRLFQRAEAPRLSRLFNVLAFILRFDRINRPRIEALRAAHGPAVPVRRLTNDRDIAAFLSACAAASEENRGV
jgi:adenylate kinase family enzyme